MNHSIEISYTFGFPSGESQVFDLLLDDETLNLQAQSRENLPPWTLLERNQCVNCPLDARQHRFCPVALNFVDVAEQFAHRVSYEEVQVTVTTPDRTYIKDTVLQQGLSSLLGVIMTTSGCPIMEPLKPMVRQHLPFATVLETLIRAVSMYLLAQFLRRSEGQSFEFGLEGLNRIYAEVALVNRDFARRLQEAATEDANINALVGLDCFATMALLIAEDMLNGVKPHFSAYMDD